MIWKLLTGIISDKTYDHLEENRLTRRTKEGRGEFQGRKDQIVIDRCIFQYYRKIKKHLSMSWVAYNKVHDMVSHSWIIATIVGLADNIMGLFNKA